MKNHSDFQKAFIDSQDNSSAHMTGKSGNITSLDESLSETPTDVHEHLHASTAAAAVNDQQLGAKTERCRLRNLRMFALACLLVSLSLHKLCDAFPSPHVRASHFATRGHAEQRPQLITTNAYSTAADVGNVQDLSSVQVQSANEKSRSFGFLTRLLQRRKFKRQSQLADIASENDERTAVNKFWRRSVRELKAVSSLKKSSVNQLNGPIRNRSMFRPSPTSTRQTIHQQTQSTTSTINKLRISRVQSFASSSTALHMVLSTPESIIEQVSTEKLLDILIDESVRTSSREPIMMQFNPSRGWIWRQWRGTVFSETWKSGLSNMSLAILVVFLYKMYPALKDLLQGFSILWGQLLSITTFTLTFFLNQSYGLWRKCYDYSRRLQGRLNDLGMTLAAHATRVAPSSPDIPSTYTPQSKQALELVSRYVRVFNLLTYASFTRSHRPILTPRGMRRLVERGILTPKEREILIDAEIPATQRHNAVLVWLIRLFLEGRQTGIFEGGYGFEEQFMEKCHVIRAQYGAIGDELQGRMPLAYAHIVQVLLDVVLWMYPFMALSTGMAWYIGVVGTGLLTMFYQGLFDLAKQFLDPYDNENYGKGEDPLVIDTLIAETNAGSVRWLNSFQQQPWSKQLLKDGEMYDSLLPVRGYSVEELLEKKAQEEAEQAERDRIIQEKKLKDEKMERERAENLLRENFAAYVQNRTASFVERSNGTVTLSPRAEKVVPINAMNTTLLEVSGGEVVSTSSLFSSKALLNRNLSQAIDSEERNATDINEPLKIYTLDDGTLVTPDESVVMNDIETETPNQTSTESVKDAVLTAAAPPLVASNTIWQGAYSVDKSPKHKDEIAPVDSYLNSLSKNTNEIVKNRGFYYVEDKEDVGYSPFKIEWFDEVGPDGQEIRLSQMLADEDWSFLNEDDENKTMDYDEFTRRANDLIIQTENEIAETKEVLYSSPGSQADYDVVKEKPTAKIPYNQRVALEEEMPAYDQTKLDSISQLWGAPPDVLGKAIMKEDEPEPKTINEDKDFANIYALWGKPIKSKAVTEDDTDVISSPVDNIKKLWPDTRLADPDTLAPTEYDPNSDNSKSQYSAFNGLEWWDTVSDDGKEVRLSMMLADEEYDEERVEQEREKEPMTYEQFALETENMIQMVEEERKETEAIMAAPPGADAPSEFDKPEEDAASTTETDDKDDILAEVVASEQFELMVESLAEKEATGGSDIDDFAILEMDADDDISLPDNSDYFMDRDKVDNETDSTES